MGRRIECGRLPAVDRPRLRTESSMNQDEAREKFGKRIQRCYGCYVAFYMRDLWLAEDATYFCDSCKDESRMFHFDVFSEHLDLSTLPSMQDDADDHHHH
jgi:hypothetical protein